MRYDLHVHSVYSKDGKIRPKDILKIALRKKLDGVAITDHETIRGGLEAKKYETKRFKIIVGSEISTDRGEVIGLFLKEDVKPGKFETVVKKIREQGGVVVLPHPFDWFRPGIRPHRDDANLIDAIEVFNARSVFHRFNKHALEFAKRYNLPGVAGSDAHFPDEIGKAGIIVAGDVKECILNNKLDVFCSYSSFRLKHRFISIWKKKFKEE